MLKIKSFGPITIICILIFVDVDCLNHSIFTSSIPTQFRKDDNDCEILLENFALASANFTFCAIRFARPIRLCQYCVEKYLLVDSVHNDILNLEDEEGKECKAKLINLDRLQVVEAGFEYVHGLWTRAGCNKCFQMDNDDKPTKNLNQNTKEILDLSNKTETCIDGHRNHSNPRQFDPRVCVDCKEQYVELNSRYDSLKESGFCMDIVDLVNLTRIQWSVDMGCCQDRKQPEWMFIVSSAVFSCLPIAFYLAAFLFASRKEQKLLRQSRLQEHFKANASTSSMMCPD